MNVLYYIQIFESINFLKIIQIFFIDGIIELNRKKMFILLSYLTFQQSPTRPARSRDDKFYLHNKRGKECLKLNKKLI